MWDIKCSFQTPASYMVISLHYSHGGFETALLPSPFNKTEKHLGPICLESRMAVITAALCIWGKWSDTGVRMTSAERVAQAGGCCLSCPACALPRYQKQGALSHPFEHPTTALELLFQGEIGSIFRSCGWLCPSQSRSVLPSVLGEQGGLTLAAPPQRMVYGPISRACTCKCQSWARNRWALCVSRAPLIHRR